MGRIGRMGHMGHIDPSTHKPDFGVICGHLDPLVLSA